MVVVKKPPRCLWESEFWYFLPSTHHSSFISTGFNIFENRVHTAGCQPHICKRDSQELHRATGMLQECKYLSTAGSSCFKEGL